MTHIYGASAAHARCVCVCVCVFNLCNDMYIYMYTTYFVAYIYTVDRTQLPPRPAQDTVEFVRGPEGEVGILCRLMPPDRCEQEVLDVQWRICTMMPGGPADQTGMFEFGDIIRTIDGKPVLTANMERFVAMLRGDPNSRVSIGYERPPAHPYWTAWLQNSVEEWNSYVSKSQPGSPIAEGLPQWVSPAALGSPLGSPIAGGLPGSPTAGAQWDDKTSATADFVYASPSQPRSAIVVRLPGSPAVGGENKGEVDVTIEEQEAAELEKIKAEPEASERAFTDMSQVDAAGETAVPPRTLEKPDLAQTPTKVSPPASGFKTDLGRYMAETVQQAETPSELASPRSETSTTSDAKTPRSKEKKVWGIKRALGWSKSIH